MLLKEAALAVGKFDEQRKIEEEKARTEQERARAPATTPVAAAASPTPNPYDGAYAGDSNIGGWSRPLFVRLNITDGRGAGTMTSAGCDPSPFSVLISPTGEVSGEGNFNCVLQGSTRLAGLLTISGRHDGTSLGLNLWSSRGVHGFACS